MKTVRIFRCRRCAVSLTLTVEAAMPQAVERNLRQTEFAFRGLHGFKGCKVETGDGAV